MRRYAENFGDVRQFTFIDPEDVNFMSYETSQTAVGVMQKLIESRRKTIERMVEEVKRLETTLQEFKAAQMKPGTKP